MGNQLILKVSALLGGSGQYIGISNETGLLAQLGLLSGQSGTSFFAIYPGQVAPGAGNYTIYMKSDGTAVNVNAGTTLNALIAGTVVISMTAAAIQFVQPLFGSGQPLMFAATAGTQSVAASFALSAGQQQRPILQLTGVIPGGDCTITLPNKVGAFFLFDVTGVTFGVNSLVFTTGSGTSATVGATLVVAGKTLLTVAVVASNFVAAG